MSLGKGVHVVLTTILFFSLACSKGGGGGGQPPPDPGQTPVPENGNQGNGEDNVPLPDVQNPDFQTAENSVVTFITIRLLLGENFLLKFAQKNVSSVIAAESTDEQNPVTSDPNSSLISLKEVSLYCGDNFETAITENSDFSIFGAGHLAFRSMEQTQSPLDKNPKGQFQMIVCETGLGDSVMDAESKSQALISTETISMRLSENENVEIKDQNGSTITFNCLGTLQEIPKSKSTGVFLQSESSILLSGRFSDNGHPIYISCTKLK